MITIITVLFPLSRPPNAQLYPLLLSVNVKPFLQFHLLALLLEEECQNLLKFHSILYLHLDPIQKKFLNLLAQLYISIFVKLICSISNHIIIHELYRQTSSLVLKTRTKWTTFPPFPSTNATTYIDKKQYILYPQCYTEMFNKK